MSIGTHLDTNRATLGSLIRQHSLLSYFTLAFTLSWGGVLLVLGGNILPVPAARFNELFPLVYLAMLTGPSIAGIALTAIVHGQSGLRDYAQRLLKWRLGPRWYAIALLTAPVLVFATLYAFSTLSLDLGPRILAPEGRTSLRTFGVVVGLGAGFFEELGWTGFAVPQLRKRYNILGAGLVMGLMWGAWHFIVNVFGSGAPDGALSLPQLGLAVLFSLGILPAWRLLMACVYDRTGSLMVSILMHASLTTTYVVIMPQAAPSATLLAWYLVFIAELLLLLTVVCASRWRK